MANQVIFFTDTHPYDISVTACLANIFKAVKKLHSWTYPDYNIEILRKLGDPYPPRFRASLPLSITPSIIRDNYFLNTCITICIVIVPY